MSRSFLTGLNLNKNELQNARIQNLAIAPSSPVAGQIYYNTGDNTLRYWNGTSWLTLAQGGDLASAISAAIDALTTDDIEQGSTNLYYSDTLVDNHLSGGNGISYASGTISVVVNEASNSLEFVDGTLDINRTVTNGWYDASGAASTAENNANTYTDDLIGDVTVDGTTGNTVTDRIASAINGLAPNYITSVGTNLSVTTGQLDLGADVVITDSVQTLTNKTVNDSLGFTNSGTVSGVDGEIKINAISQNLAINANTGSVVVTSTNGNVDIYADTGAYVNEDEIATLGATQTFSNKTFLNGFDINDGTNADSSIYVSTTDLYVAGSHNLTLVSGNGDILLNADGNVYKGSVTTANEVITQGRLDTYIGDVTVTGSTGNTITDRIATAKSEAQSYADGLVQGLNVKDSVRAATAIAGTLATDFDNGSTVGGVTISTNDRILIKNQATASENGIYVVNASGAPTRAADADPIADELNKGSYVLVTEGTYAATGWLVSSYSAGATTWTQFSAANEYTAGNGISIVGNAVAVALDSDSLAVSGSGLKANLNTGGGLDNDSGIFINTGTGLTINGSNQLTFAAGYGVRKYSESNGALTATSGAVTWEVTHDLGTRNVTVQVFDLDTYEQVEVDVVRTSTSVATLSWISAGVTANSYQVVVVG